MLGVDRQQQASPTLVRAQGELTGCDEALLVRERQADAVLERPQGRTHTGEADDGVQDDVGLRRLEQLGQVAADLRVLDAVLRGERAEVGAAGRESAELELRIPLHHLDRLPADRAGRAE